jgi:signal transduction histidine kinase
VPLLWRRRFPIGVFAALVVVGFVQWLVAPPLASDVSLLVALFTVASERTLLGALGAAGVLEVGVVLASSRWVLAGTFLRSFVFLSGLAAAALLLGANMRARRLRLEEMTERAVGLERQRDQQALIAAAAERTRIAREMHDVIAHSLAVIVTMADGAGAKLEREPERAAAAIRSVAEVGRQALGETRRLLGVLRDEGSAAGLTPQPGLAQLSDLLLRLGQAGIASTVELTGTRFSLPPGTELVVYRIVQEATTNTLRHALGADHVTVQVNFDHPRLVVTVSDNGQRTPGPENRSGHGLNGMRERLALYGGSLLAGPDPRGGWTVQASLVVGSPADQVLAPDPREALPPATERPGRATPSRFASLSGSAP